jgi:hypothetical protein
MVSLLRRLGPHVSLLPFTPYNCDRALLSPLAEAASLAAPIPVADPDTAFAAIRRARAVVVSSLHAAIFAYLAGVPFLVVPYAPKVQHFLGERGLEHRLLPDLLRLPEKLHLLASDSVDWQPALAADLASAGSLADDILALVGEALARPEDRRAERPAAESAHPERAHARMIAGHASYGLAVADAAREELTGRRRAPGRPTGPPPAWSAPAATGIAPSRDTAPVPALTRLALPRVHAVVVHHRGEHLLAQALASLLASEGVDVRTVLVANACGEDLPPACETDRVAVVRSPTPLGFSAANNLGVGRARSAFGSPDHWFFLNDDAWVEPDTVARLVAAVEQTPDGGVAGHG